MPTSASRRSPTARPSPAAVEKHRYTHKKQTGGSGQFADVIIDVEPTAPAASYEFVDKITGGRIPKEYIPAVNDGVQQAITTGVLAGYPLVDVRVTLTRRQLPRRRLLRDGVQDRRHHGASRKRPQGQAVLLEPIMSVEVVTPDDFMGDVMGDLSSPPGPARWHREAGQQPGHHRPRPAVGDVRLRYRPALADPGPCDVHDAVRLVPADAAFVQEAIVKRVRGE